MINIIIIINVHIYFNNMSVYGLCGLIGRKNILVLQGQFVWKENWALFNSG